MDASYRIVWNVDEAVQICREYNDHKFGALDFESGPNSRFDPWAPRKINGKENKYRPSALRPEFGAEIAGTALSWSNGLDQGMKSAYIPIRHDNKFAGGLQPDSQAIIRLLNDTFKERPVEKPVVVHNLTMELSFMLSEGITWPKKGQLHDTQAAARVLNKGVGFKELVGLKGLQEHVLKRDMSSKTDMDRWLKSHGFKPGVDIWHAPVAMAGYYAQDDARDSLELFLRWMPYIYREPTDWWWVRQPNKKDRFDLYELEIETAIQSTITQFTGNRYDSAYVKTQSKAADLLQSVTKRWIRNYLDIPTLNPGSATQLRGILFGGKFNITPSTAHTTAEFTKLSEVDQAKVVAGQSVKKLVDYASMDVEALNYYATQVPEHRDLLFMVAVYRKCQTASQWFQDTIASFGATVSDPWWDNKATLNLLFHRLKSIGALSGRMTSGDYNVQQIPKDFKMLIDAARLFFILEGFLSANQFKELVDTLTVSECRGGDEAQVMKLHEGEPVVNFSVRRMYIPRPGFVIRGFDLSQVEVRGFAHYTGNAILCNGYGSPMSVDSVNAELAVIQAIMAGVTQHELEDYVRDVDLDRHVRLEATEFDAHDRVAKEIDTFRKDAKAIVFGIMYGMGKRKLARSRGWSAGEAAKYLTSFGLKFPEIASMQNQIKIALRERGYVFDPFGRRYYLPIARSYVALNRLIQGWAASVFKVGFVRTSQMFASEGFGASSSIDPIIGRRRPDSAKILALIHDEQLTEMRRELDTPRTDWAIRTCMTALWGLKVPLATSSERAEVSWDQAEDVDATNFMAA